MRKKFYRLNQYIQAEEVRVIDEKGQQVGILPTQKALALAREKNIDLVEIADKAKPPVCKLINFKKFKYLEAKKEKEERKKSKKVELKEIRVMPFIAENDLGFRLKKAEEFLKEGHKVKVNVRFKGRQMTKQSFGYDLLKRIRERLEPFAEVEVEPKLLGRQLFMSLSPLKIKPKKQEKSKNGQKEVQNQKIN